MTRVDPPAQLATGPEPTRFVSWIRPKGSAREKGRIDAVLRSVETYIVLHPRVLIAIHVTMITLYLALIVIPPFLPKPLDGAAPFSNFVSLSRFVIWCVWWPGVLLSTLMFGRLWCGVFCPEGALSAYASRLGSQRAVPSWMRWGIMPLLAFVTITVIGQLFEVDEEPVPQLVILGGSTLLAIGVGLLFTQRVWAWCRYLCPVSLLFGVFSRLGLLHFRVDHQRLTASERGLDAQSKRGPCPVRIHLPVMATNRYCLMCFRCAGWRDAIHLACREPGAELMQVRNSEPLFWEVIFLFGGAIGLPLGVFHAEAQEMQGLPLVLLLLGSTAGSVLILSLVTLGAAQLMTNNGDAMTLRERFTCLGYVLTPLSLFSLFLGLSKPTFECLQTLGLAAGLTDAFRCALLGGGALWSLYLCWNTLGLSATNSSRQRASSLALACSVALTVLAWLPVLSQ